MTAMPVWVFTNRTRRRRISLVSAASAARSEVGGKVVRSVDAEKHMKNLVWHRKTTIWSRIARKTCGKGMRNRKTSRKTTIWSRIARKRCEDGEVRWKEKRHVHFTTCRLPFDHSGWSRHVLGRFLVWHVSLSSAVFFGMINTLAVMANRNPFMWGPRVNENAFSWWKEVAEKTMAMVYGRYIELVN